MVLLALSGILVKYWIYVVNPWTRDGTVRAAVVQITPRVSGPIVELPILDNQHVSQGDLLFRIDPRTFQAARDKAQADLDATGDNVVALEQEVESARASVDVARADIVRAQRYIDQLEATVAQNKAELERQQEMLPQRATSQKAVEAAVAGYEIAVQQRRSAQATLQQAQATLTKSQAYLGQAEAKLGTLGDANPQLRAALAALRTATLNLEFTEVRAPVSGFVTNLNLQLGSNTVANQPALALIDENSFWINGYFRETTIAPIRPGDEAIVVLMTYPDRPISGSVESIGRGIAPGNSNSGFDNLPQVNPTFEWIRLAQRIPVRVKLPAELPEGVELRIGTTGSVVVRTGRGD